MSRLVVLVEGETEQAFVRDQLSPYLKPRGVIAWAELPGRVRKRGGVRKWESIQGDIVRRLKSGVYCTTMFDYYAMPRDWPGREDAGNYAVADRGDHVEAALEEDILKCMGSSFNPAQFIPYVQVHEFEALAFADVGVLARRTDPLCSLSWQALEQRFNAVVQAAGNNPEAIDDGFETCPSRRISKEVPGYKKRVHGPIVVGDIGLDVLREKCRHFGSWMSRLDNIPSPF